jgi:SAM-dependent methyltransferase
MTGPTSYDIVPYPTGTYYQTHPDRLAAVATLFGMAPTPVERCRVLELACGDGGNLIPMAYVFPESTFVGIDLASRPIDAGRALIERAGLRNISLFSQDLRTLPAEFGTFDYIIAHGLYAWVAPPVQDRILAVCRAHLAPQGVAFVSYNAFPGSHVRQMLREMMQYHVRDIADPAERVFAGKALLGFLRRAWPRPDDLKHWVGLEAEAAINRTRDTLYHDELSEEYHPAYFHQFAAHAARHQLQYLAETEFHEMNDTGLPPEARETLRKLGPDRILEKEQYLDFVKCRIFRQTLLCRKEVALRREIPLAIVGRYHVETRAQALGRDPLPGESIEYKGPRGGSMTTTDSVIQGMMSRLERTWPQGIPFDRLLSGELPPAQLGGLVLQMYAAGIVDLRLRAGSFVSEAGERPEASRLARAQLRQSGLATNLRHEDVHFEDESIRAMVGLLDGTRDRTALLRDLASAGIPGDPETIETALRKLARAALLHA